MNRVNSKNQIKLERFKLLDHCFFWNIRWIICFNLIYLIQNMYKLMNHLV